MPSEVWFAIPSASVDRCRQTLPAWREMGYRVAVLQNHQRGEIPADITVWTDRYPGWAASVNHLCRSVVPGRAPIIVTGGDDTLPDPVRPAHEIADEFSRRFPGAFGVMQPTGDTFMNTAEYCGSPWLGRAWIERAYSGAGPLWPEYHHNWADHELQCVASSLGAFWQRPDLTHEHRHFSRTGDDAPGYWNSAVAAHDRADVERFIARLLTGFPGHHPVGAEPRPLASLRDSYHGPAFRYWAARYGSGLLAGDTEHLLSARLDECAGAGATRVAIYGAGTELSSASAALRTPPVTVVCMIDDAPGRAGTAMWGYQITSLSAASARAIDAVIICARSAADAMERKARAALGPNVTILKVHDESPREACHA